MESMSWMEPPVFFPTSSSTPSNFCSSCPSSATTTDSRRLTPRQTTYMYPDHGSGGQAGGVAMSCAASLEEEAPPANYGALVDEHIRRAREAACGAASQADAPGATTPPIPSTLRSLLSSPDVRVAFWALTKVSNCVQQVHLEIRSPCGTQQPHAGNLADASFRKRAVAAYQVLRCITQIAEEFERTYSTQKAWKVEDPQLRKRMRGAVSEKVVPTYRLFLEKHRRRPPKYIKYTPEEIEEQLSELYEG